LQDIDLPSHARQPRLGILDRSAPLTRIVGGLRFAEGPVWHPVGQHLTFSDIPSNRMLRLTEDGACIVFAEPSNYANGNAYDSQGLLVTCEHATSRLVRREADGAVTVLAATWQGRTLNSPNDVTVARDDTIYFTDPPYGRMSRAFGGRRPIPQAINGVYRLSRHGLAVMADDFEMPNGLCLTPSGNAILIADTARRHVRRFEIGADGAWSGGAVFAEVPSEGMAAPDGLKCDSAGNVFCSGTGGIHVFGPDGGYLEAIEIPELVANFTFGGANLKTLFIAASTSIYRARVTVPGLPAF
jgi:gluconolactonase